MAFPTTDVAARPGFAELPGGGYAVHLDGHLIGYVRRCPLHPRIWNAYTDPGMTCLLGAALDQATRRPRSRPRVEPSLLIVRRPKMARKSHGPMYGLRSNDPVHKAGRNGRVVAPIPGSSPDACIVRFEGSGRSERHASHTLSDGRCDGRPATGWC